MKLPLLLRGAFLLLLGAAFLLPDRAARGRDQPALIRLPDGVLDASEPPPVYDSVLVGSAPALVVRAAIEPPTTAELGLLVAAAARAPLLAALPDEPELLDLTPPANPRAQRAAAVSVRLLGRSGDTMMVRLSDATGALDSIRISIGPSGAGAGAVRVRPGRSGWHEWTAETEGLRSTAGAWVHDADTLHLLVSAGPPTWESRFVVRALEESGARVDLIQPLGRGLAVGVGPRTVPAAAAALGEYDAVLLLDGAEVSSAQLRALEAYVSERGGGVLAAGASAGAVLGTAPGGSEATVTAQAIRWSLPPELTPLPAADVRIAAEPLAPLPAGTLGAAAAPEGALLALRPVGRGRVAALGLLESWRWRMEAGSVAEHREFWRSLADWLAGGASDAHQVELSASIGPVGHPIQVRLFSTEPPAGREPTGMPPLVLTGPDNRTELLSLQRDPRWTNAFVAAFVPAVPGVYSLAVNGTPGAGFRAVSDAPASSSPWARLALLAEASGGAAVPADSLDQIVQRRTIALTAAPTRRLPWAPLVFGALVVLATAEWTIRRLSGRR